MHCVPQWVYYYSRGGGQRGRRLCRPLGPGGGLSPGDGLCGAGAHRSPADHRHLGSGEGGELPLASVRLTAPIPKGEIFAAMEAMKRCVLTAPVEAGTVVISHLLGYEADVIVTKSVGEKGRG